MKNYYIYCPTIELKEKVIAFAKLNWYTTSLWDYTSILRYGDYALFINKENSSEWDKILTCDTYIPYPESTKEIKLNFYNTKFKTI
jgi:predicted methyltransferase